MTVALIFLAGIMGVVIWWLARQTINVAPWIEASAAEVQNKSSDSPSNAGTIARELGSLPVHPVQMGLGVFLCVATSLFGLLMSAYYSRMMSADWIHLSLPKLMWINTAVLLASCVVVHWTLAAHGKNKVSQVKQGLLWGGLLTLLFLFGQLLAWQQLSVQGMTPKTNPSNAFFYLFTAIHGLHLLGGLCVWLRATVNALRNTEKIKLGTTVKSCALYWDYLFLVWLILFAALFVS